MKTLLLRFTLSAIVVYFTCGTFDLAVAAIQPSGVNGTHFCGVDDQWNKRYSDQYPNRRYARSFAANLNVGEPRTVRMIYFLPNDRPYRADVVQRLKDEILNIQSFYAEQMGAHGYGNVTFRVETDSQGEPIVHRVDGDHPDTHYLDNTINTVLDEINLAFNLEANVYLIVIDNSIDVLVQGGAGGGEHLAGVGSRREKNGGFALVSDEFVYKITVHELGHAFELEHDFRDRAYIMSYGPGQNRLSPCSAEFLSVHPYFNLNTPIEEGEPPTIELISPPTYPAGSQSVPIRLKVNDSEGLHQLLLFVNGGVANVGLEVKACRRLAGDRDFVVEFDYDGVIPSDGLTSLSVPDIHPIFVKAVDIDGNSGNVSFSLTVEPSMEDRLDAEVEVNIPDSNLRAAIAEAIGLPSSAPIVRRHLENLTLLHARYANISDLTGLEGATKLRILDLGGKVVEGRYINSNSVSDISPLSGLTYLGWLYLGDNNVSDISAVSGLNLIRLDLGDNNVSDISAVAGLTNLIELNLGGNLVSDILSVARLTNLIWLQLWDNNISDVSPLVANAGLGQGDTVYLWGNPLSYQSINTHIPALQSRGITVAFDNQAHPALLKISGDNQTGASFASLLQPFVVEAQDANGFALAGISVMFAVTRGGGTLGVTSTITDEHGRAQSTLILGPNLGANTVSVSAAGIESTATFYAIVDSELPPMAADVNNDGSVNVLDLIFIASNLGQSGQNSADVNGDRVVSILDLVLAAGMFDDAAAAPAAQPQVPETLTAVEVRGWLTDARLLEPKDPTMKRGFVVLEQLLVSLTPTETELLHNYPNPFNPETWIPYRLAEDAFVKLTIYDLSGQVVRTLEVGHRIAAFYESRSKAVYWDGRNSLGEQVASGVYFYTLTAGDYSATRKMVILK